MASWIYYHTLDPFLIQITETFGLRWYSLAYILGAVSAYYFAKYLIKKKLWSFPEDKIWDLITYGAIGGVAGGRIGYCLFYSPSLLTAFDSSFPFWGVLKIYEGGMASHGGIIGLLLALWLFSRRYKLPFFSLTDMSVLGGGTGIFLGRIANFINGELYGRIIQTKAPLGVKFPGELTFSWSYNISSHTERLNSLKQVFPVLKKIVPSESAFIPSAGEWEIWVQNALEEPFYQNKISHICHLIFKFSADPRIQQVLEPLLSLRHPSQLYQALLGGLLPFCFAGLAWLKGAKTGTASLLWIFSYLTFRLASESFRLPDAHIGYQLLGLTRGQWLSLSGFALAGFCAFLVYRQKPRGFFVRK